MKKNILMFVSNGVTLDPRVRNEATSLLKRGYRVKIIGWDRTSKLRTKERLDEIEVHRIRNSTFMKLLPYDIFRLPFWRRLALRKAKEIHRETPIAVVHCHDLDTLPIGVRLKKKLDVPVVYDAHEIWGYLMEGDLPKWWAKHYLRKEKRLIRYADELITHNDPIKEYLYKISKKPVTMVMNCKKMISGEYQPPPEQDFTVLYIGLLSKIRLFPDIIDTIGAIENVKFIIGGKGSLSNEVRERTEKYDNIDFLGIVPYEEVIPMTMKCNLVLATVSTEYKIQRIGLSNKIFEAMTTGRPVLTTSNIYRGKFVEKLKCGITASNDKEDLQKAIIRLRDNTELCEKLGKNGLKAVIREYNWDVQQKRLASLYEEIIQRN